MPENLSPPPAPKRKRFGFVFITLARKWRQAIDHELAQAGLTDASWTPLIHLAEGGEGIQQSELAQRLGVESSSLVRVIDLLENRGLVERRIDPADRRARHLYLSPAGWAEVEALRQKLYPIEAHLLAGLSEAEIAAMMAGFDQIQAQINAPQPALSSLSKGN